MKGKRGGEEGERGGGRGTSRTPEDSCTWKLIYSAYCSADLRPVPHPLPALPSLSHMATVFIKGWVWDMALKSSAGGILGRKGLSSSYKSQVAVYP